jgi:hypothetical protein
MTELIGLAEQDLSTTVTTTFLHATPVPHLHPHLDPVVVLAFASLTLSGIILYHSLRKRL